MTVSSYQQNEFGEIIKAYVIGWKPVSFVELGVLHGYSTRYIAEGLKEIRRLYDINTKLDAYDLFDEYQYKHGKKEEVEQMLKEHNLSEYVNIIQGNAYEVYKNYQDKSLEFLHVDISNTGDTVKKIMELWDPKIRARGLILFEGGSEERDNIEWMKKYNMPPIKKEIETNPIINKYYSYGTYFRFPSLTVLLKKRA